MTETRHSRESEKSIEAYLTRRMAEVGGLSLKYYNPVSAGWPDRIVIFKGAKGCAAHPAVPARYAWVELKSKGERPRPLQAHRLERLRRLGCRVYTCSSKEEVDRMIRLECPSRGKGDGDEV